MVLTKHNIIVIPYSAFPLAISKTSQISNIMGYHGMMMMMMMMMITYSIMYLPSQSS